MTSAQLTAAGSTLSYTTKKNRTYSDAAGHRYSQSLFAPAFIEPLPRRTLQSRHVLRLKCTSVRYRKSTEIERGNPTLQDGSPSACRTSRSYPSCRARAVYLSVPLASGHWSILCDVNNRPKKRTPRQSLCVRWDERGVAVGVRTAIQMQTRCRKGKAGIPD